jgi:histidinol-phosphate aminotransferase
MENEEKVTERLVMIRAWTEELAADLRNAGVQTFPTRTYFFLADFAPRDATGLAEELGRRGIFIKPLRDPRLGPGFMRVTTALPEDNKRFLEVLREILAG